MSSPSVVHRSYHSHPGTPEPSGKDFHGFNSAEPLSRSRDTHSSTSTGKKTTEVVRTIFPKPNHTDQAVQKQPLTKEAFIEKHLERFEKYSAQMQALFPEVTMEKHRENYNVYCDSFYRQYLQKVTTHNDPGRVL
ncbi:MAG: hypothetical protein K940chlam7_00431 [Chlamydiae bacterium]|nr:hypothetical protein [Chlamydiota bacterium]